MAKASPSQSVQPQTNPSSGQSLPSTLPVASDTQSSPPATPGPFMDGPVAPKPAPAAAGHKRCRVLLKKPCGGAPAGTKPGDELARIEFVGTTTMHFLADAFKDGFIELVASE